VAWWLTRSGHYLHLCQHRLDAWFDNADQDDDLEPVAWGWLDTPTTTHSTLVLLPVTVGDLVGLVVE
jgi:hypothetical protein